MLIMESEVLDYMLIWKWIENYISQPKEELEN